MKKRSSSFDGWADSAVVVLVIVVFLGAVVGVLLQYPIDAGKLQDPATPRAHPPPNSADSSSGLRQEDALASQLNHGKNEGRASELRISVPEPELRSARSRDPIKTGLKQDGPSQPDQQAVDQIRALQVRISELEAELSQRPTRDEMNSAQRQTEELRSQLDQATEQIKASELRANQLQAELNQRPTRDDLDAAQHLADDLRSQFGRAREQLKAFNTRINELQVELDKRPTRDDLNSTQRLADDLRSQLDQATAQLRTSQVRINQQDKELQAHSRSAQLTLIGRGDALLGSGDITSARLFYERAAEAGSAEAALRLGETYDPEFLRRARFQAQGDSTRAFFWYARARELGSTEAQILMNGLQPR